MIDLEEKQKYWREQLPKFEAKYWIPDHFSFLNFDMEQGNYVVKDDLDPVYEDDATEIYHRVNTGWAMWKKCTSSMKAEINDLKAKLEAVQVPEGFVLVPKDVINVLKELTQLSSYAEIVGGISVNRSVIREQCDIAFNLIRELEDAEFAESIEAAQGEEK